MAEIILTGKNFEDEVVHADKTVLVDFFATWCGPCRMIAPLVEEIAEEHADTVKVGKVDVDESPDLAAAFGVSSIPTLVVFRNGQVVSKTVGYCSKEEILSLLSSASDF
jgi:thioredoxin 1